MSSTPEKPVKTHSPTPSTPVASCTHHTAHHDSKARAPHNATPASAHKRSRADTSKHHAHNRPLDPTPRWDKLTQQEVPGWQYIFCIGGLLHYGYNVTMCYCFFFFICICIVIEERMFS
ncbi:hypothetical protein AMECASPLE_024592 [Ameca splendens]|uniref:Uncharacterized protein n=1 Tax=Ameca splendens TaxID=208324 RepID=A0ABV0Y4C4_9TELE